MALTKMKRARIILDLLKDGDVADEAAYDALDTVSAEKVKVYAPVFNVDEADADTALINFLRVKLKATRTDYAKYLAQRAADASLRDAMDAEELAVSEDLG